MNASPEPALPGLAVALDPGAVLGILSEALGHTKRAPELLGASPVDVQLHPGERCLVLYRLRLRPAGERRSRRLLLHVLALPAGAVNPLATAPTLTEDGLPAEVITRPDLALELRPFPIDPGLPWLTDAVDPATLRSRLDVAWRPRRRRVLAAEATPLAYVPESRAALELRVIAEDPVGSFPEQRHLVGKMDARRSPGRLFAAHWALWRSLGDTMGLAPPVGWVASLQLALQEWVEGERLTDVLGTPTAGRPVHETALALARVHRLRLPLPTVRDPEREVAQILRWAAVLGRITPEHRHRVKRLVDRLIAEIERRWRPVATVHGDFHPANVLVQHGRVRLLDWEQVAWGDPLSDVGRFLAALRVSSLRITGEPDGLAEVGEAFVEAYARKAAVEAGRLRLYEAAGLVSAAASPFRLQREGWREAVDVVIAEAEQVAHGALARPFPTPSAGRTAREGVIAPAAAAPLRRRVPVLSLDRVLKWARDPTFLLASLVPLLNEAYPETEFLACRAEVLASDRQGAILRVEVNGEGPPAGTLFVLLGPRPSRTGLRGLNLLAEATVGDRLALGLPRALGPVPSLRASVVESRAVQGAPLAAVIAVDEEAADQLAHALERLGRSSVELGRGRTAESTVASVLRPVERMSRNRDAGATDEGATAWQLAQRAAAMIARCHRPGRPGVLLDGLSLSWLVDGEGRPTALAAWRARWGDPLVHAGGLVADVEERLLEESSAPAGHSALARALARHLDLGPAALSSAAALHLSARASRDRADSGRLLRRAADLLVTTN